MTRIDRKYIVQPLLTRELEGEGPVGLAEELGERGELDFADRDVAAMGKATHERILDSLEEVPILLLGRIPHCRTVQEAWDD